jgi:hypothetical protein
MRRFKKAFDASGIEIHIPIRRCIRAGIPTESRLR